MKQQNPERAELRVLSEALDVARDAAGDAAVLAARLPAELRAELAPKAEALLRAADQLATRAARLHQDDREAPDAHALSA
jgi:hypothetical protein